MSSIAIAPVWLESAGQRWLPRPGQIEALIVRVWLDCPLAYDGYNGITIEGVLQWVVGCREAHELPSDALCMTPRTQSVDIPIPIEEVEIAGVKIHAASWGRFPAGAVEDNRLRRKRTRTEVINLNKIMVNGGPFKSIQIPVACVVVPYVDFSVRADRERLSELLCDVQALGRDRSRGPGHVMGCELLPDPQDRSLLINGAPQRTIPIEDGDLTPYRDGTYELRAHCGYRAPYWHQALRATCVVPALEALSC